MHVLDIDGLHKRLQRHATHSPISTNQLSSYKASVGNNVWLLVCSSSSRTNSLASSQQCAKCVLSARTLHISQRCLKRQRNRQRIPGARMAAPSPTSLCVILLRRRSNSVARACAAASGQPSCCKRPCQFRLSTSSGCHGRQPDRQPFPLAQPSSLDLSM